jgi:two-component system CheB/CheR fusion protein
LTPRRPRAISIIEGTVKKSEPRRRSRAIPARVAAVPDMKAQELISRNEELQSMNAELKAAREKLLSINEELTTANKALHTRNQEISALKHDVTDAQLASSDSNRANLSKDEFLATLSHELRTPLSSMLMRAQLLRRGGMDEAKVKRAGEAIEAGVKRQVQLIDDLLDVSRIVSGKLAMDQEPVDLGQVVTAAVDALSMAVERKSLTLDLSLPSGDGARTVMGDDARLQQVVSNLLGNAIKFTPEHGTVRVALTIEEDTALIRVTDTGIGIDTAFLSSVFERFAQASSENSRAYNGLGLGLAIVRHLVELHHGSVQAESAGKGAGATFTVRLPLMKLAQPPAPAESKPLVDRRAVDVTLLGGLRILVMDDDPATREATEDLLRPTGAVVRLAHSAAEGLHAVEEFVPDVLLCDIAMPGEDGYAFMRKLRALPSPRLAAIPALALTALAHDDDRERALAAGFQMHVAKPVDIDRLAEMVLELAGNRTSTTA